MAESKIEWTSVFEVAVVDGRLICTIQSGYPKAPHALDWAVNDTGGGRTAPRLLGEGRCASREDARAQVEAVVRSAVPR